MKKIFALAFVCIVFNSFADVRLPRIFGSGMVLQRGADIPVWGWAAPGEKITVRFNKQVTKVTAGKDGRWKVNLGAENAGGPYQLIITGKNTLTLRDVLVGEVWICSGQSNMEWQLRNSNDAAEEIRNAHFPLIRHFTVPKAVASEPLEDISEGEWKVCTPENAGDFTAVGYFFARELFRSLDVPVGLVHTSWGGTHSETWTSREAFESSDEFREMIEGMPRLDLDSIARIRGQALIKRIESMQGPLDVAPGVIETWKGISADDSGWQKMDVPGLWEGQALGDVDGVVWLRRTIDLKSAETAGEALLELSTIDDSDETFVNGIKVGSMQSKYNEKRVYTVPRGVLMEGRNVIAVRVTDTGGGGGIYGDPLAIRLTVNGTAIPLAGEWSYRVESVSGDVTGVGPNSFPTLLYNGMIHPLIPLAIRGAIWYQGESNAGRAFQYRKAFPLMIADWRKQWGQGDFPFYFVQLASYNANNGNSEKGSSWAELREAQSMTLSLPNTGMAVTTDIGDPHDIHPRNKQDVGKRLAAIALHRTYGRTDMIDSGPVFRSMKVDGDKAILSFDSAGGGLTTPDRYGYLRGFEIAGQDGRFRYAKAFIEGNSVVVFHRDVSQPVAVRFGWADDASDNNLFNAEGFPAVPFRTDNWSGITERSKFSFGR